MSTPEEFAANGLDLSEVEAAEPAAIPLLRDLVAQPVASLTVRSAHDDTSVVVWLVDRSGGATGVPRQTSRQRTAETRAEAIVRVADIVQDAAAESSWSAGEALGWPRCPLHPGKHPMAAAVADTRPVWRCPGTKETVAVIGSLSAGEP